jgi:hypothetical protein
MELEQSVAEVPQAPPPAPVEAPAERESPGDRITREEQEMRDDLAKVYRNATRERGPDGKFASKNGEAAPIEAPVESKAPAEKPVEAKPPVETPKAPATPPPQSWSAESRAHWDKLPPEVQTYINQRETEAHAKISELGQKARFADDFQRTLAPILQNVPNEARTPEYISNLYRADAMLSRDPVEFIKLAAQHHGIDLASLVPDPFAVQDPQTAQWEARHRASQAKIEELERRLGEVGNRVIDREKVEQEAKNAEYQRIVDEFAKDKPDINQLMSDMLPMAQIIMQANPNRPPQEVLKEAYERAQWANPQTRAALLERQAQEAERKKIEDAKAAADKARRAASINVRSSPAPANANVSIDDDLRGVWRRHNSA